MSGQAQSFPAPKQSGIYFDDFITRNRWEMGRQMPVVHFGVMPPANIYETREAFIIELVVPGVQPDRLQLEMHERALVVNYTPEENNFEPLNRKRVWRQEFRMPAFQRQFDIHPDIVDPNSLEWHAENGLLRIVLTKRTRMAGSMLPIVPFSLN
ncbi:MAG: Hsp20/alpha crystallin family protein [Saprospiraceae bacterium]|nr:Hsp20/alpha crystallin family protein [Saprospiraceae bacterium]